VDQIIATLNLTKSDKSPALVRKLKATKFVFVNTDSFNYDFPKTKVSTCASQIQVSFWLIKDSRKKITVEVYDHDTKFLNSFTFSK
jgi:hypothetical protein